MSRSALGRADLELHGVKAGIDRSLDVVLDQFVAVAKPADGRVVAGIARSQDAFSLGPPWGVAGQQRQGILTRHHVFQIAQIEQIHHLLGRQIEEQTPERQTSCLGPEIEAGVGDGGQRQMDHALVRTQPAPARMIGDGLEDDAKLGHQRFNLATDQRQSHLLDHATDLAVAVAQRESQPGSHKTVVALQQRDRIRIDRVRVDRISALARLQRIAGVAGVDAGDCCHGSSFVLM